MLREEHFYHSHCRAGLSPCACKHLYPSCCGRGYSPPLGREVCIPNHFVLVGRCHCKITPRGRSVLWKLVLCQGGGAVVLQQVFAAMLPWGENETGSKASDLVSDPLWQGQGSWPSLRNHQPQLWNLAQGWAPCLWECLPATLCGQPENPSAGKT